MHEQPDGTATSTLNANRPQTSTRDLVEVRQRLEAWMVRQLPAGAVPQVSALEVPPSNGMSSETLLFDATWREDGTTRTTPLVARVAPDPAAVPVFQVYDLDRQFRVMRQVAACTSVPIPPLYWSEPDSRFLGEPFFVMGRVHGQVPPDVPPYVWGGWVKDATPTEQKRLQDSSVAVLAKLHAIEQPEQKFSFLQSGDPRRSPLRRHVDEQWAFYQWTTDGVRVPVIERSFEWLEQHWPKDEGETVFSWGDARIGNIMYRDFEPVAVFDWEMAALGTRGMDLGWMIYIHRFFDDMAVQFGMTGMPHLLRREDVAATYESLTGFTPRDLDFYTMYSALRHGIIMNRIQRRAIRFGEATMPDDPNDLVMHRSTLEEMIAGTYWPRIASM
ncbi:MAG: putative aminoglycoside phosphotransferase [Deltaproteobacteria bacterium]|nr:putative aminoglycoside phosphotransferase [Deltaproteobacteria bacterium]